MVLQLATLAATTTTKTGAASRSRRYRALRRRNARIYPTEFADSDVCALIELGQITDAEALDPRRVGEVIAELARSAMQKTATRGARSPRLVR
jgi:hypothetical protein